MATNNPAGTDGFDFLELATRDLPKLHNQLTALGFIFTGKHRSKEVILYQQNQIRFMVNTTPSSMASHFADEHGASVSAMGFRVKNANAAYQHAVTNGAIPYISRNEYHIPAIYGVGGTLIYFVEYQNDKANYAEHFTSQLIEHPTDVGLTYIDHVTHNLYRGNLEKLAKFYQQIFNFHEIRYFDIEGKLTGLKSKAMTSPCGKIRIPLNESTDDKSQVEEFLKDFNGEGIQHVALGTSNIYHSVEILHSRQIIFMDTPSAYYNMIEKRLPNHKEPLDELKKLRILIDGSTDKGEKLLLQIFTKNMLGPAFFEIIQRKGDEGFGEGNFRALFESIEQDQIDRGVLT